jgi:chromosomal replication initiator protein
MSAPQFVFIPHPGKSRTMAFKNMPCIAEIQCAVADLYGIRQIEMLSERRHQGVAWPRQVAMYLCREMTTHSLPAIGRMFGGRDHTTIIHGCRKVEARIAADETIAAEVDRAREAVGV